MRSPSAPGGEPDVTWNGSWTAFVGARPIPPVRGDFSGDQTDFNPWGSHDWHTNHPPASGSIYWFDSFLSKFDLNGNFQ